MSRRLDRFVYIIRQISAARHELAMANQEAEIKRKEQFAESMLAEMNMSQAIKLEPCTLLDELRLEHKILSRDIELLSGERLEARRIVLKSIKDQIHALESVR